MDEIPVKDLWEEYCKRSNQYTEHQRRDFALTASLTTKPQTAQEMLSTADKIYNWLNPNL